MFLKKKKFAEDAETPVNAEESAQEVKGEGVAAQNAQSLEQEVAEPNEAFFGTVLIGCFILSLIAATGYFGFVGYRYYKSVQSEKEIPSITLLPVKETESENANEENEAAPGDEAAPAENPVIDKKTLEVKVLNGGAAKGVAGTYAEKLKKEGFEKTVIGNTFGSYTGAALYYAKGQESGMEVLKVVLLKDYPKALIKEAEAGNKDTSAAPLTIILGR